MYSNKKAQTGETITWVVATIIVFVILLFFIFGASLLGDTKKVVMWKDKFFSGSDKFLFNSISEKSLFTYFLTSDGGEKSKIKSSFVNSSYDFNKEQQRFAGVLS